MFFPSSPPLVLDVSKRRLESGLAVAALALAALTPWMLASRPSSALFATAAVSVCLVYVGLRRAGWLVAPNRIVRVAWLADGRWRLTTRRGETLECELRHDSRVTPSCVWLRFRCVQAPRRVFTLLLARSDGAAEELRRLIVRLRIDGPGLVSATASAPQ